MSEEFVGWLDDEWNVVLDQSQPIVRCRDCHWSKPNQSDHEYRAEHYCNIWASDVSADGFCFRGRRKENHAG